MNEKQERVIYDINHQILSLICNFSKEDPVLAQLIFGLPSSLVSKLTELDANQIDTLSLTQGCLLTLRSCADEFYWQRIITGSTRQSNDHLLNLKALSMIRLSSNELRDLNETDISSASVSLCVKEVTHAHQSA